jgi:hypothetical protein
MNEEKRRIGKFTLSGNMLRDTADFETLKRIMDRVVVLDTDASFATDEITYYAYHPSFDIVPEGRKYPTYLAFITTHRNKIVSVEWKKSDEE